MPHAVARVRQQRLAQSTKPFVARGARVVRCERCRVSQVFCACAWLPTPQGEAGVCLLMHDYESLKPSNTGWLIADTLKETFAFTWQRTAVDPELLTLLDDPQWFPMVIFPAEYAQPERVVEQVPADVSLSGKKPLFIILDATWTEARKMFRKSPYLDRFPVLSLHPQAIARYRLRRGRTAEHLCTAQVAALCLELADEGDVANTLSAWLEVFSDHYLAARDNKAPDIADLAHKTLVVSGS